MEDLRKHYKAIDEMKARLDQREAELNRRVKSFKHGNMEVAVLRDINEMLTPKELKELVGFMRKTLAEEKEQKKSTS